VCVKITRSQPLLRPRPRARLRLMARVAGPVRRRARLSLGAVGDRAEGRGHDLFEIVIRGFEAKARARFHRGPAIFCALGRNRSPFASGSFVFAWFACGWSVSGSPLFVSLSVSSIARFCIRRCFVSFTAHLSSPPVSRPLGATTDEPSVQAFRSRNHRQHPPRHPRKHLVDVGIFRLHSVSALVSTSLRPLRSGARLHSFRRATTAR
jgi:hypothetical protein